VAAPAAAALLVMLLPMGWGIGRAERLRVVPAGRVAVVQPGVGTEARLDPVAGWTATRQALDRLLPELEGRAARLVVLPEVALRARPGAASPSGATEELVGMARRLDAPVVFGALGPAAAGPGSEMEPGEGAAPLHNSAYLATGDGLAPFRYDKRRLVPGVERTPLGMDGLLPGPAGFAPGRVGTVLEVEGVRAGVLICYESLHADLARAYRRAGADLLLNLTHDGWFGGGPGEPRTVALAQHPAHLVLRAIETRMGVARAAATGVSLFVDPLGRLHHPTPLATAAVRVHDPGTTEVRTAYVRWGDVAGTGSALLAFLLGVTAMVRAPRPSDGVGV
jgi:apolipoprotein N-acyltransferase